MEDSLGTADKAKIDAEVKKVITERARAKKQRDSKKIWNRNTGKPFMQGEFMRWTDKTTSRKDVIIECMLGEGIQLHKDHLLGDVLRNRPLIVRYDTTTPLGYVNYAVEAFLVLHGYMERASQPVSLDIPVLPVHGSSPSRRSRLWNQRGIYHVGTLPLRPAHIHGIPAEGVLYPFPVVRIAGGHPVVSRMERSTAGRLFYCLVGYWLLVGFVVLLFS